ncbi:MAG: hypothetical protein JEZ00_16995 [Anaerolineaceae bacterium]|nr:hypothetical protein [Anaerolineaceae bacterium]
MCKVRNFLVVALLLGLLVGCVQERNTENTSESTPSSIFVQDEAQENPNKAPEKPQESPCKTQEITSTQEGTRAIIYITYPTQTVTLTRAPTKSVDQFDEFKRNMYATNGGCELPCLWGLAPGGKLEDVIDVYFEYGLIRDYSRSELPDGFPIYVYPPEDINLFGQGDRWHIQVHTTDGLIDTVEMNASYLKQFNEEGLEWLLKDLGNPEEIELRVFFLDRPNSMYEMHLYYPDKGVRISWRELVESIEIGDTTFQAKICPKDYAAHYDQTDFALRYSLPRIYSWIPGNNPFKQLANPLTNENADADLDHFYETYFESETVNCFTYKGKKE